MATTEKTGLVLEGGGVRGLYTAGVLDSFLEQGLSFDGVIGVSAGAIHGCSFLSRQKGRSLRYYKKYSTDPRFMSLRSWITTGNFIGVQFAYHTLPEELDIYDHETFLQCGIPFYVVCSNVETGQPEYLQITDMLGQIDRLRASASLPYFSRVVELEGQKYLDGGCTDSVPVEAFRAMGYHRNVVILTQPADYRKKPELRALPRLVYGRYPALAQALLRRHITYNQTAQRILELEREGSIFVIRPEQSLNIGRLETDPVSLQRVYDTGYADARRHGAALLNWLQP